MTHVRTRRAVASATLTTLVAGLLTLVVMSPAQANHGSLKLEVFREVTSAVNGTAVTLTVRLMTSTGAPPTSGGVGVEIDFEVEGGTVTDGESGAITPEDPDEECVSVAPASPGGYPECTESFVGTSSGESLIRAWIDHDTKNETGELGGTEADKDEGRLSSAVTDCVTELPGPAQGGEASDETFADCAPDGEADPGRDAERDETDVVSISYFNPLAPLLLNCNELTATATGDNAEVLCIVSDTDGRRRPGVKVDAKHLEGANDPNSDDGTVDYEDGDQVSSDAGFFTVAVDGSRGQTGFATVCAWIDSDDGIPGDTIGAEYDIAGTPADGGECEEALDAAESANTTDVFRVQWQNPVATTVDVEPESGSSAVGTNHTLTATVRDQFGRKFSPSAQAVGFEFQSGSPSDADGSSPTTADKGCNTSTTAGDAFGTCSTTYTSQTAGTDTVCAFILANGAGPSATCNGETLNTNPSAVVDVVTKTWTAQGAGTPTNTTAPNTSPQAEEASRDQGYTLVGSDGGIFNYGTSQFHGSTGDLRLNQPVIGLANKAGGTGYWLVARDGGIFTFGDAEFFGSTGDLRLNAPILGMEATPSGKGYFLFAADGGIFTFGDAKFFGSTGDMRLNAPAVGLSINEKGDGYWLVAQDGGIFTFGAAPFHGSTGNLKLNQPVFDMAPTAGDQGYYLVAKDGGIFSFGDAENRFFGSAVGSTNAPVIGIGTTPTFGGYWIADARGAVFPFGDARFLGDRADATNSATTVGFATVPKT